jgi:hypothetical protein
MRESPPPRIPGRVGELRHREPLAPKVVSTLPGQPPHQPGRNGLFRSRSAQLLGHDRMMPRVCEPRGLVLFVGALSPQRSDRL